MPPVRRLIMTKACDWCRQRKVKCDGAEICSNCRISRLPCRHTAIQKKRGPRVPQTRKLTPDSDQLSGEIRSPGSPVAHSASNGVSLPDQCQISGASAQQSPCTQVGTPQQEQQSHPQPFFAKPGLSPTPWPAASAQALRDELLMSINSSIFDLTVFQVVNRCIDLYMQYIFPAAPFVHEPTLRASALRFYSDTSATDIFDGTAHDDEVGQMRRLTLITVLCASVASVMPESLLRYGREIAGHFLNASRGMLKLFEDYDVEHPNSYSIAIRLLLTTALQHITGKADVSNYILGQAAYLAQEMRLYSEEVLTAQDPLEAQLLRNAFWHMYAADKAASCLGSRPISLHELLFKEKMTVHPSTDFQISLYDTSRPWYESSFERRLLVGFHFPPRLWSQAASLITEIKALRQGSSSVPASNTQLMQAYMAFLAVMDDLPNWLQGSKTIHSQGDSEVVLYQKTAFWVQRCTILVVFQCLRLVILHHCIENEVLGIVGLNDQELAVSMTKVGMVQDFVQTLDDIPFIYLQVKGEPTIERIRWVGSILLEILDTNMNEMIRQRAEHYFSRLLDLLAGLDSRSVDVLEGLKGKTQTKGMNGIPLTNPDGGFSVHLSGPS